MFIKEKQVKVKKISIYLMNGIKIIIQVKWVSILFKFIVLQLYKRQKKIIEEKCSINAKQCNTYLNSKKVKMTNNVAIYRYKNIL